MKKKGCAFSIFPFYLQNESKFHPFLFTYKMKVNFPKFLNGFLFMFY